MIFATLHRPHARATTAWSLGLLWAALCLLPVPHAHAQTPSCTTLFKQKAFLKAAACFEAKAKAMGKTSRLSKIQRYLKGQALRNAAMSYKNSAQGIKNIEIAAYRRSLALTVLQRYLKENLCQRAYLCKLAKGETLELINLINYTQLSIVTTPGKRAFVEIKGYKFNTQHISPPQWNEKVRPGRYKITVKYEGGKPTLKEVLAPPGQSVTVTMLVASAPPPRREQQPQPLPKPKGAGPVPWIVTGLGAAAAVAGGVLLIVGQINVSERDRLANALREEVASKTVEERAAFVQTNAYPGQKQQIDDAHNTAAAMIIPGWILVGVGAATLVTGIVLAVVLKPKPATPPTGDAKAKSHTLLSISY